jgi:hypothetical protein
VSDPIVIPAGQVAQLYFSIDARNEDTQFPLG